MAACSRTALKALAVCQRQLLSAGAARSQSVRTFAFVKAAKKEKKEEVKKKEPRVVVDDKDRHKPRNKTAWAPKDDVYVARFYPQTLHGAADAVHMLKRFQKLDFTEPDQLVYVDLKLDMKLEKKKKIDPFVSIVHLPHPFTTSINKVLVFTENPDQVKLALDHGAAISGGSELVQQILDDEISADFYVTVPNMMPKIVQLKNKLRKKFPKASRGTVGPDIPKMLQRFKFGHEYLVERDCYVIAKIAKLDMPSEHILANLKAFLLDVCSHRPADKGPFIERAIIASHTSEAIWLNTDDIVPKPKGDESVAD